MRLIKSSKIMPLLSAVIVLQFACSTLPPSAMEPVNRSVQTGLAELDHAAAQTDQSGLFSFRIITPVEKVDLFSILQAATVNRGSTQNTLPVGQLKEVILAKERILNTDFIGPEEAQKIGFFIVRYYSWDTELARQALNEVMSTYTDKRNAQWRVDREKIRDRAVYLIERNKVRQDEYNKQAKAVYSEFYENLPEPQQLTLAEQQRSRELYQERMQRSIEKNKRAQDEYAKQARAAHEVMIAQLLVDRQKSDEKAARQRKLLLETVNGITVKSLNDDVAAPPYTLYSLANGDFMIDSRESLPALIQLQVKEFEQPILVPVMPQTRSGRLLISIDQDSEGRPIVYGGMDANTGLRFDLSQPIFSIIYTPQGQVLEFIYPDGHSEQYPVDQLKDLSSEQATELVQPLDTQVDTALLEQKRSVFADIHYQFTPELEYMSPDQALDVLSTVQENL